MQVKKMWTDRLTRGGSMKLPLILAAIVVAFGSAGAVLSAHGEWELGVAGAIVAAAVIAIVLDRRHVQPGTPPAGVPHDLAGVAAQQDAAFMARTTRSVAHDLRNVFQVVNSCAIDLYGEMHGRRAGVLVLEILNAAERGLGVTTELARAGRDRTEEDRPVDLRLLARELDPILRRLAAASVNIDIDCVSTGVFVRIDRTSVMQILMNLVDNAAEAMGRMGRISIYVGRDVRHISGRASEHVAVMTVTDDGPGMPSDVVAKVFDVGFSTKEGHHAGLGLSVVHSVVQRHGGHIWVSSEPGVGTSFRIEMPLVERDEKDLGLVVLESDHARHVVSQALAANGFDVVACADALEACDLVDPKHVPAIAVLDAIAASDEGLRVMASLGSVPLVRTVGGGPGQSMEPTTFDEAVDLLHHGGRPSMPVSKDDSTPRGIPRIAPNIRSQSRN